MRTIIASGCNEAYYPKCEPFMRSVQQHRGEAEAFFVGVGWLPPEEHGFRPLYLPLGQAIGHSGIYCVQGGSFLDVLPAEDDDLVIFTDGGDLLMQRPMNDAELALLGELDDRTMLLTWNAGPEDTLGAEVPRIHPNGPIPSKFDLSLPCYNTGVIAARASTYRKLYERYVEHWDEIEPLFDHFARQQWLISWILGSDPELRAQLMPRTMHAHGHHGRRGCRIRGRDGMLIYRGHGSVCFRHKL